MLRITPALPFAAGLLLAAGSARALDLAAGPMVGYVTDKSARLWMQFPIAGEVSVTTFDVESRGGSPVTQLRMDLEGPTPFVCDVPINNLVPSHSYRVEVKFEGEAVTLPDLVIRTAPPVGSEATFSIAFGSGLGLSPMRVAPTAPAGANSAAAPPPVSLAPPGPPVRALPIFKAVTSLKPRAFLFLGDTGYLPPKLEQFPTTHRAAYRFISDFHSAIRREPDLQELFRSASCYAIYDDRDFGTLDADGSFVFAQESLVAFERFWPNPDWGTPEHPGCFCTFTFGDVDFFMLDTRTFRSPPANAADDPQTPAAKMMLGEAQLAWLEDHLKKSTAAFKVLAAPCALWGDDPQQADSSAWSRFPAEQQGFMKWLAENQINGVLALAGNQAAGQLTRLEPQASHMGYPLFTLGCSTLAAPLGGVDAPVLPNAHRVGQTVPGDTFGTLDFGGERDHRFATLRIHDASGKTRIEQILFAGQIRNGGGN